ncbi:hypothetical protein ACFROC_36755, partial [Nocardia tengchongensis]
MRNTLLITASVGIALALGAGPAAADPLPIEGPSVTQADPAAEVQPPGMACLQGFLKGWLSSAATGSVTGSALGFLGGSSAGPEAGSAAGLTNGIITALTSGSGGGLATCGP